jgi:hypothetical protein
MEMAYAPQPTNPIGAAMGTKKPRERRKDGPDR